MISNRMYRLRRALLAALYEYDSYQDLDTVLCNPAVICVNPSPEEARTEWKNLREWGLTDALAGYGGSVCRLSAFVRKAMEETGNPPRDERLWGYGVC